MAELKDVDNKPTTSVKPAAVKESQSKSDLADKKSRNNTIIVVIALAVVGVGLLITAAVLVMRDDLATNTRNANGLRGGMHVTHFGGQGFDGTGRYVSTEVTNDSVTTTVYNYKRGVVVAVNKDSIEIAGGGKRTTIKTNSSTVYTDDTKPAVNDTVTVTGTTTDGTITATEVTVQN